MAHQLDLPELPATRPGHYGGRDGLSWGVTLDDDGDIIVRLLRRTPGGGHETVLRVFGGDQAAAEERAALAWENYLAVNGPVS